MYRFFSSLGKIVKLIILLVPIVACGHNTGKRMDSEKTSYLHSMGMHDVVLKDALLDLSNAERQNDLYRQLFASSVIADIYTYYLVDFEKAKKYTNKAYMLNEDLFGANYDEIKAKLESDLVFLESVLGHRTQLETSYGYVQDPYLILDFTQGSERELQYRAIVRDIILQHNNHLPVSKSKINQTILNQVDDFISSTKIHPYDLFTKPTMLYIQTLRLYACGNFSSALKSLNMLENEVVQATKKAKKRLDQKKSEYNRTTLKRKDGAIASAWGLFVSGFVLSITWPALFLGQDDPWQALGYMYEFFDDTQTAIKEKARLKTFLVTSDYAKGFNLILDKKQQFYLFSIGAKLYNYAGNVKLELSYLERAINLSESCRSTVAAVGERIAYQAQNESLYFRIVDLLYEMDDYRRSLEYAERYRARTFVDLLDGTAEIVLADSNENQWLNRYIRFQAEKDILRSSNRYTQGHENYIKSRSAELSRSIKVVNDNRIFELKSLAAAEIKPINEIARMMPENALSLIYYITQSYLYCFTLTKNGYVDAVRTEIDYPKLKLNVETVFSNMTNSSKPGKNINDAASTAGKLLNQDFNRLSKILLRSLKTRQRVELLIIIPHRCLNYIPFSALQWQSKYLIETFAICICPSLNSYFTLASRDKKRKPRNLVAFGNPTGDLIWAEKEAEMIAKGILKKRVYKVHDATKAAFQKEAPNFDCIHFAGHAIFDGDHPFQSGLLFGFGNDLNQRMSAEDFYRMELNADLLTLSACSTGRSQILKGDELTGLLQSVFFAGSNSVLATLWDVDDQSTMELMVSFYSYYGKYDKADSLRRATLHLLTTPDYRHPYYWAGFQLYGFPF